MTAELKQNIFDDSKWHGKLPPQQLPFTKKTKAWRKAHLQWADSKSYFNYNPVRSSVRHKKINFVILITLFSIS